MSEHDDEYTDDYATDGDVPSDDSTKVGVPPAPKMPSLEHTLPGGIAPLFQSNETILGDDEDTQRIQVPDAITYRVIGMTDVGLSREHNEDNFLVADLGALTPSNSLDRLIEGQVSTRGIVLGVCDGMGGAAAGEIASQMAVDVVLEDLSDDVPIEDRDDFARRLVLSVEDAGTQIFGTAKRDRDKRGMGTTATIAGLIDKVMFVGQVGDSRCYVFRNGHLSLLTKDQSLVNQLIEAGQLTEEEAESFEHSNIILQALGTTERVSVDLTFLELRRGDRVLMCSDGLCGLVHDSVIENAMGKTKDLVLLCRRLINLANDAGGHDNITCVVAEFDGAHLEPPSTESLALYQQYPLPIDESTRKISPVTPVIRSLVSRPLLERKRMPSLNPKGPTRTRAFSWATASSVLLLFALSIAITTVASENLARSTAESVLVRDASANERVEVTVQTESEGADLLVNGEAYGPLKKGKATTLKFLPGAYRFELNVDGDSKSIREVSIELGKKSHIELVAQP